MGASRRFAAIAAVAAVLVSGGCAVGTAEGPAGDAGGEGATVSRTPVTRFTPLTEDDGYVPEGEGLDVDADVPALTGLDADLLAAVREAAEAAEAAGVEEVVVISGWRSERYQEFLWDAAVDLYASEEEARRWVASPEGSAHVTGEAVDIGRTEAAYWFSRFGGEYGLCQTYANEVWHYELVVEPGEECPPPADDASVRR
ncbi:D-alanyl-D-alanine carboxypeptidase family protein [Nocardiopsis sp. N85]|uniref:D-alanyl-D-alanine carboxypeptidase family protein n=1 Tax=Nocardiopsis sp. N85 TaxID=3029400 RepID=UPI00237F1E8D|nr:D-alanyl-D-alanine carboxypeptidase family protein [Nocardiopsis sp. N85]MDE3724051.1 D-alanyl-D-alanine carboxypeptidase family protein [Nocardiopsis sp. N85]